MVAVYLTLLATSLITLVPQSATPSRNRLTSRGSSHHAPLATLALDADDHLASPKRHSSLRRQNGLCTLLSRNRPHQRKMCQRAPSVARTLLQASRLALLECQYQFKDERWNCSLEQSLMKKGTKETAYVYAISSAALVHTFARTCAQNMLEYCTCDQTMDPTNTRKAWRWGGCGDNLKYALKFTRKFLKPKVDTRMIDLKGRVNVHNTNAGIKVVKDGLGLTCKCHGVSGSCTIKTCWRQLAPFYKVGKRLKSKYERSRRVHISNAGEPSKALLLQTKRTRSNKSPRYKDLVYVEKSPNFCDETDYSSGTSGRRCEPAGGQCEEMCCGRGYNTQSVIVQKNCHCHVVWCCEVKCDTCLEAQQIYTCK